MTVAVDSPDRAIGRVNTDGTEVADFVRYLIRPAPPTAHVFFAWCVAPVVVWRELGVWAGEAKFYPSRSCGVKRAVPTAEAVRAGAEGTGLAASMRGGRTFSFGVQLLSGFLIYSHL